jgi:hypothetical protein
MSDITFKIHDTDTSTDWDQWLKDLDKYLKANGYNKRHQNYKSANFVYWKTINDVYQIGILIYNFSEYAHVDHSADRVSVAFECVILGHPTELCTRECLELYEFEAMAQTFYDSIDQYLR